MSLNKRGHMPTIMLFVAGIALYVLILFSFVSFKGGYLDLPGDATYVSGTLAFDEAYASVLIERVLLASDSSWWFTASNSFNEADFKKNLNLLVSDKDFVFYPNGQIIIDKIKSGEFKASKKAEGEFEFLFENVVLRETRGGLTGVRTIDFIVSAKLTESSDVRTIDVAVRKVYKRV